MAATCLCADHLTVQTYVGIIPLLHGRLRIHRLGICDPACTSTPSAARCLEVAQVHTPLSAVATNKHSCGSGSCVASYVRVTCHSGRRMQGPAPGLD